jgi:hypothetical protein
MPKNQQKKAVSSDRLAGAPYATRCTRGGESGLLVEQDEEGKKQERRVTRRSSQPNCSIDGDHGVIGEEYKPLKIGVNCDYSTVWKGLCRGGAVKRFKLPCTCCMMVD